MKENDAFRRAKANAGSAFASGAYEASIIAYTACIHDLRVELIDPAAGPGRVALQKLLANRSLARLRSGDEAGAFNDAQEAIALDESWQKAWFRMGSTLLQAAVLQAALLVCRHGLSLEPKNTDFATLVKKCEDACQQAAESTQTDAGAGSLRDQLRKQGLLANSVELVAAVRAGAVHVEGKSIPAAVNGCEAALSKPSSQHNGSPSSRQPESKAMASEQALPLPTHGPAVFSASDGVELSGSSETDTSDSESEAEQPVLDPEQLAQDHKSRGGQAYKAGLYEAAREAYGEGIALLQGGLSPTLPLLYNNRSAASLMLRRYDDALNDSLYAVELDNTSGRSYARAAKACLLMGRMERATLLYSQALLLLPEDAGLRAESDLVSRIGSQLQAASTALEKQQWAAAEQHAAVACRMQIPAVEEALRLKVEALLGRGRTAEAVSESRALTRGGDAYAPEVLSLRARCSYSSGNITGATRLFEEAMRRDPDNTSVARGLKKVRSLTKQKLLGNEAFKSGSFEEAYQHYSTALSIDSDLRTRFIVELLSNRSAVCCKLGRFADAISDAELAISIEDDFQKAYLRKAAAYMGLQQFEEAVRDYTRALELGPELETSEEVSQLLRDAKLALKKSKRIDYYGLLEVALDASPADIKKAFRRACLKWHPDKALPEAREENEKMFKLISEGNGILTDELKRRKYDQGMTLEEIEQGGGMHEPHGYGGGDPFSSMFGHSFR